MFGVSAMVLTGIGADTFVAKADILEDTAEDNTEGEDDISTGNNPRDDLRNQLSTKDSTTIVHDGFSYYWYNNNRPNQKTKNGYYQTRYEYLDLPKKQTEIDNIDKKISISTPITRTRSSRSTRRTRDSYIWTRSEIL